MSIKYVILGFLSETPLTGYDLKKKFSESEIFHWSGNNNQIYRTLVELHEAQLVTVEVQVQASKPSRKIYTITDTGLATLRRWLRSTPELPQFRDALLLQLAWADQLDTDALSALLTAYEDELHAHVVLLREQMRRDTDPRQPLRNRIAEHWLSFYELELEWVRNLREEYAQI